MYFVEAYQDFTHLINTGDGLILLDVENLPMLYLVVAPIWELGFNPHIIKYINIYWHNDYTGSAWTMADLSGAKQFVGYKDAHYLKSEGLFTSEILLYDGDIIKLGKLYGNSETYCRDYVIF